MNACYVERSSQARHQQANFIFILHLMKEIMQITDHLCQALQSKSQEFLSVMHLDSSIKTCIQQYRDDKWKVLLIKVKLFCNKRNIDVLDMNARYVERSSQARHQQPDFIFILHLIKETMQITYHLCQALQSKSQEFLSVMRLVSSTKTCIQRYRDDK